MQYLKDMRRQLLESVLATMSSQFGPQALRAGRRGYRHTQGLQSADQGYEKACEIIASAISTAIQANNLEKVDINVLGKEMFGSSIRQA